MDAIGETQRACEAATEMKLAQLRDEMNEAHADEIQLSKNDYNIALKDKQTADLDIERLTNKVIFVFHHIQTHK